MWVTYFIKIKKWKFEFEPWLLNLDITKFSTTINETGLNETVHIERVFWFKRRKNGIKDGRKRRIQECKVKDDPAIMILTMFGHLIDEGKKSFPRRFHI